MQYLILGFIDFRKCDRYFEKIAVQFDFQFAALELCKVLGNGKAKAASFGRSGGLSRDKSLGQIISRDIHTQSSSASTSMKTRVPGCAYFSTLRNRFSMILHNLLPSAIMQAESFV